MEFNKDCQIVYLDHLFLHGDFTEEIWSTLSSYCTIHCNEKIKTFILDWICMENVNLYDKLFHNPLERWL